MYTMKKAIAQGLVIAAVFCSREVAAAGFTKAETDAVDEVFHKVGQMTSLSSSKRVWQAAVLSSTLQNILVKVSRNIRLSKKEDELYTEFKNADKAIGLSRKKSQYTKSWLQSIVDAKAANCGEQAYLVEIGLSLLKDYWKKKHGVPLFSAIKFAEFNKNGTYPDCDHAFVIVYSYDGTEFRLVDTWAGMLGDATAIGSFASNIYQTQFLGAFTITTNTPYVQPLCTVKTTTTSYVPGNDKAHDDLFVKTSKLY